MNAQLDIFGSQPQFKGYCKIEDCAKLVRANGLCGKHYMRVWLHGSTDVLPRSWGTLEERFWRKVIKTDGCWGWNGHLNRGGYAVIGSGGRIGHRKGAKMLKAHRVSYELHHGPIPEGLHIDHLCSNRACTNPAHLEAVTQAENNRRSAKRAREYRVAP